MIPVTKGAMKFLHQGAMVLSEIEHNGVRVNVDYLDRMTKETTDRVRQLEDEMRADKVYSLWHRKFGAATNVGSHSQLAAVVFGKDCLGYEVRGYTAKNRIAAGKDQLDDIDEPIVEKFLQMKNLKDKVLGTYLNDIRKEMVRRGKFWYVHPFYNIHTITTFRSSSNSPNFQNQPKRDYEMAKLIRPNYCPHPGQRFVEFDFSQLEVRISQCYHHDPAMKKYIQDPTTDMHRDTAMDMFFLTRAEYEEGAAAYKKTIRDSSKNQFVFPQFFGSNYVNCCKAIWKRQRQQGFQVKGMPLEEYLKSKGIKERGDCVQGQEPRAGTFEAHLKEVERIMWHKRFRVYTAWKKSWYDQYRRDGGFRMHTGFAVNGVYSRNAVTNYPIQGSAFHCLLWVLIELSKWLKKHGMKTKIIGEIHDAVQLSVEPSELQDVLHKVYSLMTKELPEAWKWISVPLEAECDVGEIDADWMSCKEWECKDGHWREKRKAA